MNLTSDPAKQFTICLKIGLLYLASANAFLLLLVIVSIFGYPIDDLNVAALKHALAVHVVGAGALAASWSFSLRRPARSPLPARVALAALPLLVLVSLDRISLIYFPIEDWPSFLMQHPTRGWTNRPNSTQELGNNTVEINSMGFRGPEIQVEKPAGEYRIVVLGDSIPFGLYVNEEESFVRVLENMLRKHDPTKSFSVINCSASGYSQWQEYDMLQSECLQYKPDLVIHAFCLNDVVERFELLKFGGFSKGLAQPTPKLLDMSGIYQMLRATAGEWLSGTSEKADAIRKRFSVDRIINEPAALDLQQAWATTFKDLRKIHALCYEKKVSFIIVCFPYAQQLSPFRSFDQLPQSRIAEFASSQEIPFVDLLTTYRQHCSQQIILRNTAHYWEGLAIMPDKVHPNSTGHLLAAQKIYAMTLDIIDSSK